MSRFRKWLNAVLILTTGHCAAAHADETALSMTGGCSYFGEALPQSTTLSVADGHTLRLVSRIVDVSGLAQNFDVRVSYVPNAAAVFANGKRYILYNPTFLAGDARPSGTAWGPLSVLAHEIGHHLNGHTLTSSASRPDLELQADYFSGFVLQKLGAPLGEATRVMATLAPLDGGPTHPGRVERIAAIKNGWTSACRTDSNCFVDDQNVDPLSDSLASEPSTAPTGKSGAILHGQ